MLILINKCNRILKELNKFSDEELYLGIPINDERLELLENQIGYRLPVEFTYILKRHNGISLNGIEILGIDKSLRQSSLDKVYEFEHSESQNKMPVHFLPFSPDGRGNHYCLDLSKLSDNICPVVFWQHDITYTNIEEVEECNPSLIDWIKEVMIDWTIND